VYLGRGYVNLGEQLPLEACEGQAQTGAFEHRLVKEEKGLPTIGPIVHADRLPGGSVTNGNVGFVATAEGIEVVGSWVTLMVLHVYDGSQGRALN